VAEQRFRQQRRSVVVANLAYALVVADAGAATTSLVAGEPWDSGRFWLLFFLVLLSAGASSVASAVARRTTPEAQRKSAEDDEMTRAMRTGSLPPSADPQSWRRRIRRQGREAAVIGAVCSCLCIAAAELTATAPHLNNDDDPMLWTLAVMALLLLAPLVWVLVQVRCRGQRLLARL
jgi:hypothetical protein